MLPQASVRFTAVENNTNEHIQTQGFPSLQAFNTLPNDQSIDRAGI